MFCITKQEMEHWRRLIHSKDAYSYFEVVSIFLWSHPAHQIIVERVIGMVSSLLALDKFLAISSDRGGQVCMTNFEVWTMGFCRWSQRGIQAIRLVVLSNLILLLFQPLAFLMSNLLFLTATLASLTFQLCTSLKHVSLHCRASVLCFGKATKCVMGVMTHCFYQVWSF